MTPYSARCHCGAIRFRFSSDPITAGYRCNCSFCIRKGSVMSRYLRASAAQVEPSPSLADYQFGDKDLKHHFCRTCGIFVFTTVASIPPEYTGPAQVGDYRVNLGCVEGLDALALEISVLDGRSL